MKIIRKYFLPFLLVFIVVAGGTFAAIKLFDSRKSQTNNLATEEDTTIEEPVPDPIPDFIDLQPVVDEWVSEVGSSVSVAIYDLDNDRFAALHNANLIRRPASLYKLFYIYDAYKAIDAGIDNPDDIYINLGGSRGQTTIWQCLEIMVSESNNACAEAMLGEDLRDERVAAWIAELGLTGTASTGLETTAADLVEVLKMYYYHPDWSETSYAAWQFSALEPATNGTDYRKGLPSGFNEATVYNKVGWQNSTGNWEIYNDAALVEFTNLEIPRHYIVVVMTGTGILERYTRGDYVGFNNISRLGAMLEDAILNYGVIDDAEPYLDAGSELE